MTQFKAIDPKVEVKGSAVLAVVEANPLYKQISLEILAANGIVKPDANTWYPQQAWLDAYKEIAQKTGSSVLKEIGRTIPDTADWPEQILTMADGLASIDTAYQLNHRGGEIGHYKFEPAGEKQAYIICNNPYPCDFDLGIIEATAEEFASEDNKITIQHHSADCRNQGDETCIYHITWNLA